MRKTTLAWPFLALMMLIPLSLAAQNLPGGSAFTVTRDSGSGIQINFELPDWEFETLQRNGETFSQIRVPGIPNLFIEEEETLPVFSTMIAIPYVGGVSLRLSEDLPEFRPGLQLDFAEALASERRSGRYQDALYPATPVLISEPMLLRDFRVVTLNVHPFQWDSASGELVVRENISINLDFGNGPSINEMAPPTSYSPAFEKIYQGLILNYDEAAGRNANYHNPRLLVIYGNYVDAEYQGKVDEYVAWKRQKGYVVEAVSTATTGSGSSDIKAYIQAQYDNAMTRPDYITLIGDASGTIAVPTYNSYVDYYYTWLAGSDNLGDAIIGRISVDSASELVDYIAKINILEKDINLDLAAWLDRMVLVGDTASSGISTVYTNEYIYDASIAINPEYTYTKNYSSSPPATTTNAAINQGVAFYNYRGYIGMSGWPGTMSSMANAYRLFHAIFITCNTGTFGSSTSTTESVVRYGTEASLGGAVTAIGMATSSTHTPMNNCLDVGIFHGIYPLGMRSMAEAMLYGKLYLYAVYGVSNSTQAYNFSGYCNIIGDPTATVYVGIPSQFSVDAPTSIPAGETNLLVSVSEGTNPVPGASVALTNSAGPQALAFTDASGNATLEFSSSLSGSLELTISMDDFKPFIQSVEIASAGGLVYDGLNIDDSASGNGDGEPNAGETMDLYVSLKNTTSVALTPFGEASCSDPNISLISFERIEFNSIPAGASGESVEPITLEIAPTCPDQYQFVLNFEILDGLYSTPIPVIVSNGRLEILTHSFVGSPGNLVNPGDAWPLTLTLQNVGSANLSGLSATLSSQDTFFEVTDAQGYYGTINSGATAGNNTDTFFILARSTCVDGMVIPLMLELYTADGFAQSIPLTFSIGQTTVTDPLGQDAYGYFIFGQEDTGYDQCPDYNWIGIAPAEGGNGTALSLTDPGSSYDEGDQTGAVAIQTVSLPFSFKYYGVNYSQASISSNGFIAFGATTDADWRNWRLPDAGGPSPMVAVFWDDLDLQSGSSYVYTWYNSALHYYVVEWYNLISGYDSSTPQTFQAILYDPAYYPTHTGDGQIKLQYKEFNNIDLGDGDTYPHGNYSTIGIEDHTETVGLEYTFGNSWPTAAAPLTDESALFITTRPLIPDYPYVVYEQANIQDPNSNQHLEPGEAAQLSIRLGNRGLVDATGVSAVLSSSDTYVTVITTTASYGTVPAQGSAWSQSSYSIQVAANCPADHVITFTLGINGGNGSWSQNFQLGVFVPEFEFRHLSISDYSGDQNGILDPGETATLTVELHNTGEIPTPAGTASLSCSTPGISLLVSSDDIPILPAGAQATLSFELSASSAMSDGTLVTLILSAAAGSTTASLTEYLEVGAPMEVLIGEGTQTQSYPLDRYYNYSAHEAIYLASEIAMAGTIKSLALQKASGSDTNSITPVSIYMKNTSESTLASGNYSTSGYTLVYSGSFPNAATGWMEVDLDPMFLYDGVSNLAVLTVKGYQQWISGYPYWSYSTTQANRARQNRSDSAAPSNLLATPNLPNLRLKIFPSIDMLLPPQNLSAAASHGYVSLSWDAPASGEPDGYCIYRDGSLLASPASTQYTDAAVTDGITYEYYVTAIYDGEESPVSGTVSATPNTYSPTNLTALPGNAVVDLSWTAAEGRAGIDLRSTGDRAVSGYRIYRDGSPVTTVAGTSYQDSGLSNGATYSYYVTTVYADPAGESAPSNTVSATPNMISEVVLGDGASSTPNNTACPINITYKSLHGQSVYTAAELNAQGVSGPVYITGLAFWVNSAPDYILPDFIIRLKHTTDANVANWQGATDMVTVFSAASYLPTAGGWDVLSFQTPFLWNGSQNIVVDTAFGLTEEWTQSGTVRYSYVSNGYRCTRDDYSDQTNVFTGTYTSSNRPNVKLLLVPYQTGPEIAISPQALDFGAVQIGSSSLQHFTIANSGDSVLFGSISTPTGYMVEGSAVRNSSTSGITGDSALREGGRNTLSFSIPAGADQVFNLTFAPTQAIAYNGSLQISSNDPDEANLQLPLSGSGFELSLVPPAVSVSLSGNHRVLSWEAVPDASSYRVWSCGDPYGGYELLDTISDATTFTDTRVGLVRAFYRVTAINE
ncbi:MAG: C25 family cysteine peptidase [Candidatus Cloacimonadaceae bacterium]